MDWICPHMLMADLVVLNKYQYLLRAPNTLGGSTGSPHLVEHLFALLDLNLVDLIQGADSVKFNESELVHASVCLWKNLTGGRSRDGFQH